MKNGVFFAIMSSLVFSLMNVLVKMASLSIPSIEIAFFRSFVGTVLLLLIMKKEKFEFSKHNKSLLVLRGLFGAMYLICYFYTISKIPLADASILVHLSPFFVILFATVFLKERLNRKSMMLLPIVVIGALLIIKPFNYSSFSVYSVFGLASAVFAALASITVRKLSKNHQMYEIVFYFLFTATVVSIPLMWNQFVVPTPKELLILVCIGVVSLCGQVFLTKAFTHENAIVVAVTRYIGIVFNIAWGIVLFKEVPNIVTISGGVLIVGACMALTYSNQRKQKAA